NNAANSISIDGGPSETDLIKDAIVKDQISIVAPIGNSGIRTNTPQNLIVENFLGINAGFGASNSMDVRRGLTNNCLYTTPCTLQHSPSFSITNALTWRYNVNNGDEFSRRVFDYSHGWRTDTIAVWGSRTETRTNSPPTPPGNVDPLLGSCRVFIPDSSPMKRAGKNGADIGANVLYAYENGVLNTSKKLWNTTTGAWASAGAIITGVNDVAGASLFDVHQRLNVNTNGCTLPASYTTGTPSDTSAPSVPTGLTATAVSSSQINISWTASTDNVGVAGYKVFRGGVQIATVTTGTSYSNTGLSQATTYSYTVSAYDAAGNNSAQSTSVSAATQSTAPSNLLTAQRSKDSCLNRLRRTLE
ncbi:MAG: chitosanase, partial [Candidatus Giovannonibacteria bacterium GW2011_GWA1_44_29]